MTRALFVLAIVALISGCDGESKEKPALHTYSKADITSKEGLEGYKTQYLSEPGHKAFAQSEAGSWGWKGKMKSIETARAGALGTCRSYNKGNEREYPCKVINVDGEWVTEKVSKNRRSIMRPEQMMGFGLFIVVWGSMMLAMTASWVIMVLALWRGMKAHESIAESLKRLASLPPGRSGL